MPPKSAKPKAQEVDTGPVKIDFLPQPFIEELQRRRDENDYTPLNAPTVDDFLAQLLASPDIEYNTFKIWTHRLVRRMRELLHRAGTELVSATSRDSTRSTVSSSISGRRFANATENEYALLLLLNLMVDFVRNAENDDVQLFDFVGHLHDLRPEMGRNFPTHSWFCLLSVLNRRAMTTASLAASKRPSEDTRKRMSRSSKNRSSLRTTASSSSAQSSERAFVQQLDILVDILRKVFEFPGHMRMFALMVRRERFWQAVASAHHRINIPRPLMTKKSRPETAKKLPDPPVADADDAAKPVVALTPEEEELLEQRKFLLPLMMTTNLGNYFWEMMFEDTSTTKK